MATYMPIILAHIFVWSAEGASLNQLREVAFPSLENVPGSIFDEYLNAMKISDVAEAKRGTVAGVERKATPRVNTSLMENAATSTKQTGESTSVEITTEQPTSENKTAGAVSETSESIVVSTKAGETKQSTSTNGILSSDSSEGSGELDLGSGESESVTGRILPTTGETESATEVELGGVENMSSTTRAIPSTTGEINSSTTVESTSDSRSTESVESITKVLYSKNRKVGETTGGYGLTTESVESTANCAEIPKNEKSAADKSNLKDSEPETIAFREIKDRDRECPTGFIFYPVNGNCYVISDTKEDWFTARNVCREMGASLVSIETMEENHFLFDNIQNENRSEIPDYFTGGNDIQDRNRFTWDATNSSVDPDEVGLLFVVNDETETESCLKITALHEWVYWTAVPCERRLRFICEKRFQ